MHLFSKGLASISAMELVMDQIASTKNIDRTLSEDDTANDHASFRREGDLSNSGGDDSESITSSPSVFQVSVSFGNFEESSSCFYRYPRMDRESLTSSPSAFQVMASWENLQITPKLDNY